MNIKSKITKLSPSVISYFQKRFNSEIQTLDFRFPIETLDELLKKFYKDHDQTAFLVKANKEIFELGLKKISKSYLLSIPLPNLNNEHIYIGLSDVLSFLILFDEPNLDEQSIKEQKSRFFITFDSSVINELFEYFYMQHCNSLSLREKKLLIKLKTVKSHEIDPQQISKFQEALLINALNKNNKIKNEKITEALSFTDEAILISDVKGNIIESNNNFKKDFKVNSNNIKDILSDVIFDNAIKEVKRLNKWQMEIELPASNEVSRFLLTNCYLFRDELNRPNGYVFTFKDVTELRKLDILNKQLIAKLRERNLELTETNQRLLEADMVKNDLLSVVSHELKTPLSTILGFSELITNREYDKDSIKQFTEQINSSAKQLDRLISDYLDVACNQLGVNEDELYSMPINLAELVRLCYHEQKLKYNNISFDFDISCLGFEPIIIAEERNVRKLFDNLIDNALKYSPSGGRISVKILNDSENVTVSISDQGVGLTSEQLLHVFEPFYRADNSVTREFRGVGLGLAVCKRIVELYKGSIWCERAVNAGTMFNVALPVNVNLIASQKELKIETVVQDSTESKV